MRNSLSHNVMQRRHDTTTSLTLTVYYFRLHSLSFMGDFIIIVGSSEYSCPYIMGGFVTHIRI